MEFLVLVLFFAALAVASALGWTADSRDGADWAPTSGGFRAPRPTIRRVPRMGKEHEVSNNRKARRQRDDEDVKRS